MIYLRKGPGVVLAVASILCTAYGQIPAAQPTAPVSQSQPATVVNLRWGARPGVFRFRLQLSRDAAFADIVFDRVVSGHEYRITDLTPGRYFWRVAPLGARRGEFSSAGVIDVPANGNSASSNNQKVIEGKLGPEAIRPRGWYAAIGNVTSPLAAHLRSRGQLDIVSVTSEGRVVALDAVSGVALWIARARATNGAGRSGPTNTLLTVPSRAGLDNVLVLSSGIALLLEGRTGRETWRAALPGAARHAAVIGGKVFIVDTSLQKLFVINGNDGKLTGQAQLPRRAVGAPVPFESGSSATAMIAVEDGQIYFVDQTGAVVRSGNAGSAATTSPLFLRSARGGLVLVGTRNGLTALNADDLRPLGRITLKDDTPRGRLFAQDLDNDGVTEVVMFTSSGRLAVVRSDEGKIVWEGDAMQADAVAFADLNADLVLDLIMAGREGFAFALSGRDGAMIWEDKAAAGMASNHATLSSSRSVVVAPTANGVLLIAGDPSRGGLRAIEVQKAASRSK